MSDDVETPKKKPWLKDVNVLIGIGGVIVTIIVGVLTYWLTTDSVSREYQERIRAARNDALTSVARSIGEGVVPNKEKVQAVLNSVRRQYNIKEPNFETPETVIDDVITRVLANEFLDAKRREELSEKLMAVKAEKVAVPDDNKVTEFKPQRLGTERFAALFAFITSMVAAVTLLFIAQRFKRVDVYKDQTGTLRRNRAALQLRQVVIMLIAATAIVILSWISFTQRITFK